MVDYRNFIEIRAGRRFGQPCIKRTRITVSRVLAMLASDIDNSEISSNFPESTGERIKAALLFAADHEQTLKITL